MIVASPLNQIVLKVSQWMGESDGFGWREDSNKVAEVLFNREEQISELNNLSLIPRALFF